MNDVAITRVAKKVGIEAGIQRVCRSENKILTNPSTIVVLSFSDSIVACEMVLH